jgi:uncharacterized membrane protein
MKHIENVREINSHLSKWVAKGPLGARIEWSAEVIQEVPNELIAWQSVEGSEIKTSGSVRFVSLALGEGTEVKVNLKYSAPGGKFTNFVATLLGKNPETQIQEDLERFRDIMESHKKPTHSALDMFH